MSPSTIPDSVASVAAAPADSPGGRGAAATRVASTGAELIDEQWLDQLIERASAGELRLTGEDGFLRN